VENPAEGEVVPIDPKDTGDPDASMLLVDASKPIGSPPNGSSPTRNLVPRNNSVARKSKRGSLIARVRSRWRNAKTQVVEEWRKEHPNAQKPMAAALTRIVKEAKLKDEETKRAGETREDRLKDFLTQDKDVERLLIRIRKEDLEREKREQKQKVWEKEQQLSAKFIVLPDSKVKRYWELYVLFMVVASLLLVPMDIAFQLSVDTSSGGTGLYFFMFFVFSDCTFIADLVLSFRTAVTREEHELVKRPGARRTGFRWMNHVRVPNSATKLIVMPIAAQHSLPFIICMVGSSPISLSLFHLTPSSILQKSIICGTFIC